MAGYSFGIDLGTGNIKIYNEADNSISNERNMIALQKKDTLFAYGNSAYDMYEKAPDSISISYPLVNGVIADIHNMETVLHHFVMTLTRGHGGACDFYISVPTDVTDVQKRAFFDLIYDSDINAKRLFVVEKGVAAGLGMNSDLPNTEGMMVVDVGFATTEISVLSLGGIVLSKLLKTGGGKYDELIQSNVKREYNLLIGSKTAEKIRMIVNELSRDNENALVYGRDLVTGLPREREIPPELVIDCLQDPFHSIAEQVRTILERTPPHLAARIRKSGIWVTGGAGVSANFPGVLEEVVGVPVNMARNPSESAALGLAKIMQNKQLRSLSYMVSGS